MMLNVIYFHIQSVPGHMFMIKKVSAYCSFYGLSFAYSIRISNTKSFYHRKRVFLVPPHSHHSPLQSQNWEQRTIYE